MIRAVLLALLSTALPVDAATTADEAQIRSVETIVAGAYVITMDPARPVIENGAVAIDQGGIVAVGSRDEIAKRYRAAETLPGEQRAVLPGLTNVHTHAAMVLFRGLADDLDLMTWLQDYIFPMEGRFVDPDFVRAGMRLACWEMIRGGTTSFVDMYFYPEVAAEVVQDCGLRAVLGAPMIDFSSPGFEGWDDSHAAGVEFVRAWKDRSSRIRPALAPHAPYSVSPEHLAQVRTSAADLGVPVVIHVAEDRAELKTVKERYGTTPIQHLAKLGLLDQPLIAAHVVWPQTDELPLLAREGIGVSHNPTSNLKTAAGISPVPDLLAAGAKVGLGTDGAASNNDLDLWEEIRLTALIHKGVRNDATAMPAAAVLRMATLGGAEAAGLSKVVGSLAVGKRADLIQVALDSPRMAPLYDIVSHLVYVTGAQDVVTTMVDGRVLMREGKVLSVDGEAVRVEAMRKGEAIRAALAKAGRKR